MHKGQDVGGKGLQGLRSLLHRHGRDNMRDGFVDLNLVLLHQFCSSRSDECMQLRKELRKVLVMEVS
jgi:hypothetical protein